VLSSLAVGDLRLGVTGYKLGGATDAHLSDRATVGSIVLRP
jgi:hypothetical protein